MLRYADKIRGFNIKREEAQNPYIGFMSFQHFRGEKLYSDIVVRPENGYTETERVECYPVRNVAENGRDEGYYPDTTVVYIRMLWKDFEPSRGVYDYGIIEDVINKARSHGQTVIFRLMAHSTRACDDVPDWLKEIIPCPERPDGARVKDSPTDPLFTELFLEAIKKIGERFDSEPLFDAIDISLPGAWGEGYNLHLYPDDILTKTVDVYTSVFKNTRLIGQVTRPDLIRYANESAAVGWRGDGFGEPKHTNEAYPEAVSQLSELWKTAPVSFESYWWIGEWMRKGWSIDNIIERSLEWHVSSFNAKSLPIPYEWREKVDAWVDKMGYHYAIDSFEHPEEASSSDTLQIKLTVDNIGVAPIYNKLPFYIRLKNSENEYVFKTDVDIRKWLPGMNENEFEIKLPENAERGDYSIEIGIYNEIIPVIYFATDAERIGAFYKVGNIKIN